MGSGGIKAVLDASEKFTENDDLQDFAISALKSLLYECPSNARIFTENNGVGIVLMAMEACIHDKILQRSAGQILCNTYCFCWIH